MLQMFLSFPYVVLHKKVTQQSSFLAALGRFQRPPTAVSITFVSARKERRHLEAALFIWVAVNK